MLADPVPPSAVPLASPHFTPTKTATLLPSTIPENAPEHCPGTESADAGLASACAGCANQSLCASAPKGPDPDLPLVKERLKNVKRKILVLSGKGGVGKSTFSVGLGWALSGEGEHTGLLDIDITGPSLPLMIGLPPDQHRLHATTTGWSPMYVTDTLSVMSIGFMLPSSDSAVIWRGPKKNGMIKQFLKDVDWTGGESGEGLDYMVIDTPPGTSDEHLSIVSYLKESGIDGAVIVTTPQELSLSDVRREVSFCRKVSLPILGIVENMSGFVCPSCRSHSEIFFPSTGGAQGLCEEEGLELLGKVPLDPRIGKGCDFGRDWLEEEPDSMATRAYFDIVDRIREKLDERDAEGAKANGRAHR